MTSRNDMATQLARAAAAQGSRTVAEKAIGLVDLTSLGGHESTEDIDRLCRHAVRSRTAAVCVYPRYVRQARGLLDGSTVRLATVVNFPEGGDDLMGVAGETAAAAADGADEIDVVAPLEAIREGDLGLVGDMLAACREAAGAGRTLKVILETGVLQDPVTITAAARSAVMAGADFLKTSTGKAAVGATLEAAQLLLTVCAESGGRVGFKAAGGIRTTADAAGYLLLADEIVGKGWASPATFRFGASGLLDDLLRVAGRARESTSSSGGGY